MKKRLLFILMFVLLTSCGTRLLSVDGNKVVVAGVDKHSVRTAEAIADKACAKYGKQAFKVSDDKLAGTVTYKCIEPY